MKVTLMMVGKTTDKHMAALIKMYAERIMHFVKFELEVLPELRNTKSLSVNEQKAREGEMLLKRIDPADRVCLLDEHGVSFPSAGFATWLTTQMQQAGKRLVFVIGGPYGFSPEVYQRAQLQLSLSPMTLSHQLVRVFFVEQLYRGFTIIHHLPYHHE